MATPRMMAQPHVAMEAAGRISAALERFFWPSAAVLVALFAACTIVNDIRGRMWYDELVTLQAARQGSPREILSTIRDGADSAPPMYALIAGALLHVIGNEALAVRLPSSLGYCALILCLLVFCRARLPAVYAFLAALLACKACLYYSTEGRPYGIVLGCAAGALVCWQAAIEHRRRTIALPLLAVCLAVMTAAHYFAIFFAGPLLLAEVVRWRRSGQADVPVLGALLLPAPVVLAVHAPLIIAGARFQTGYWSPARWRMIQDFYLEFFRPMLAWCLLPVVIFLAVSRSRAEAVDAAKVLKAHEWVAILALSLMPAFIVAFSKYTTHVFVLRYALWTVIGFAVLMAALAFAIARAHAAALCIALLLGLGIARNEVKRFWNAHELREGQAILEQLRSIPHDQRPLVMADHHAFLELYQYAPRDIRNRLVYPLNRELQLRYKGYDSGYLIMSAIKRHTALPIVDYDQVLAANPRFILAAQPSDYLPWHLVRSGYRVTPIDSSTAPVLFDVERQ